MRSFRGKPTQVFVIQQRELRAFAQEAKKYGVLYAAVVDKRNPDGLCDIVVSAEDAARGKPDRGPVRPFRGGCGEDTGGHHKGPEADGGANAARAERRRRKATGAARPGFGQGPYGGRWRAKGDAGPVPPGTRRQ